MRKLALLFLIALLGFAAGYHYLGLKQEIHTLKTKNQQWFEVYTNYSSAVSNRNFIILQQRQVIDIITERSIIQHREIEFLIRELNKYRSIDFKWAAGVNVLH